MTTQTTTVRPNSSTGGGSWAIGGGAASLHAAVSDNNSSTKANVTSINSFLQIGFAAASVPSTAQIRGVTLRAQSQTGATTLANLAANFTVLSGVAQVSSALPLPPNMPDDTRAVASFPTDPATGQPWTLAAVNASQWFIGPINGTYGSDALGATFSIEELYLDVLYNDRPTAAVTGPSGSISDTSYPTVTWTVTDPENDPQERHHVKIFSAAQYGAGGFDPETSAATQDFGEQLSAAKSFQALSPIANGPTYKAYVKVADAGSGGRYSAWDDGPTFTMLVENPATPSLTATVDDTNARVALTVTGHDNKLDANQASLETNTTGWIAGGNTNITRSTTLALNGLASLRLASIAAGTVAAQTPTGTSGFQVTPGAVYSAGAYFRSAASVRTCRVDIQWYKSSGAASTVTATNTGSPIPNTSTTTWVYSGITATAPSDAAYCSVVVNVLSTGAASELHYVDQIILRPGIRNFLAGPNGNAALDTTTNLTGYHANLSLASSGGSIPPTFGTDSVVAQNTDANPSFGFSFAQVPATAGQSWTMSFYARGIYRARAYLSFVGATDSAGPWTTLTANSWDKITYTVTAPVGTTGVIAYCMAESSDGLSGKQALFDAAQLESSGTAGDFTPDEWSRGGLLSTQRFVVERSTDRVNWTAIRTLPYQLEDLDVSDADEQITTYDYEAPRNAGLYYRARAIANFTTGLTTTSLSTISTPLQVVANTGWWLKSTSDPTKNIQLAPSSRRLNQQGGERQGVFNVLGRRQPVIVSDVIEGDKFSMELTFMDQASFDMFESLRGLMETVLLQTPYGIEKYVHVLGDRQAATRIGTKGASRIRTVQVDLIEQDA